ncbi:hypothetical protein [Geodermatophilus sp. SYSU D00815]
MDDELRRTLFDPAAAHGLVLAHRPPAPSAVQGVVSDVVWGDVVRLLRWATAAPAPELAAGTWWRLAAGCADFLRRYPGLSAEVGEPWDAGPPPELAGSGADRVAAAADRLAARLRAPGPLPLHVLAAEVDALGAAAVSALAERSLPPGR